MWTPLLFVTAVWAASPCELPAGQEPQLWLEPLAMAGLAGPECPVRFVDEGTHWTVVAVDPQGVERSAQIAAPRDAAGREDAAWLAASLAMPLGARLAALQESLEVPGAPPLAEPEPLTVVKPKSVVRKPLTVAPTEPSVALEPPEVEPAPTVAEPEPPPPRRRVRDPIPIIDEGPQPEPWRFHALATGGGGASVATGLAAQAGIEIGFRPPTPVWLTLGLELWPSVTFEELGRSFSYRAWSPSMAAWYEPHRSLELGAGLELAHLRYVGAKEGVDAGWSPGLILALRAPVALRSGLLLVPGLGLRAELRSTELVVGHQVAARMQPLWLAVELGLGWQGALER
jgi:hypothetical protein